MRAEFLAVADRQLERRALQMVEQDLQIVRIDMGMLRRTIEEIVGMLHDVLIERRAGRHQHRSDAVCRRPARPRAATWKRWCPDIPPSPPRRGSDVDAQLQCVGGDHGADIAVAQLALDLAALLGQIAAAIAANARRRSSFR